MNYSQFIFGVIFRRPGSAASNASGSDGGVFRAPTLPGKSSLAATMAAARQQQILQQYNTSNGQLPNQTAGQLSNLPDFTVSKNDMSEYT